MQVMLSSLKSKATLKASHKKQPRPNVKWRQNAEFFLILLSFILILIQIHFFHPCNRIFTVLKISYYVIQFLLGVVWWFLSFHHQNSSFSASAYNSIRFTHSTKLNWTCIIYLIHFNIAFAIRNQEGKNTDIQLSHENMYESSRLSLWFFSFTRIIKYCNAARRIPFSKSNVQVKYGRWGETASTKSVSPTPFHSSDLVI